MCAPPLQWHPGTLISLWAQPLTLGTQLDLWFNKQMISPFHSIARSAKDSYCISVAKRGTKRCVGVKSAGLGFPSTLPLGDRSVQTSPVQPLGKRTPSSAHRFFGPRGPAPEFQMKRHGRLKEKWKCFTGSRWAEMSTLALSREETFSWMGTTHVPLVMAQKMCPSCPREEEIN